MPIVDAAGPVIDARLAGRGVTQRYGWWWCAGAAVLFGAAMPATKPLVDDAGAVTLAGLLYLGAALAVAPFARARPQATSPSWPQRSRLALAVAVGGGVAPVLLVSALHRTPAGTVSLLLNLEVVATAVVARLFLREHLGRRAALGIVVVVAGGVVLAGFTDSGLAPGALLVAGACLCWGVDNAVTAGLDGYSPTRITLVKGAVAGTVNLGLGIMVDGWPPLRVVGAAVAIGVVGYGLSITMWITGARQLGAARGQAVFALAPFVGLLASWPINGDHPTTRTGLAAALSLAGVALVASARHHHLHVHEGFEHAHPIDARNPHHAPDAVVAVEGVRHRHVPLAHEHGHLPDIHHRHGHEG